MKHYFEVEVAAAVGVNAAVVFENIAFWILHNEKQGKNKRDGAFWMYATQKDLAAQFDYLTEKQVRTAIDKLKAADYLRVGNYNRHAYDRTNWMSLTNKGYSIVTKGKKHLPLKADVIDAMGEPIPDSNKIYKINNIDKDRVERIKRMCGVS